MHHLTNTDTDTFVGICPTIPQVWTTSGQKVRGRGSIWSRWIKVLRGDAGDLGKPPIIADLLID